MLALVTLNPLTVLAEYSDAPPRIDVPGLRVDGAQQGWNDGVHALVPVAYVNAQPSALHTLSASAPSFDGTTLTMTQTWAAPSKDALVAYATNARWVKEQAGITFSGIPIPTDDRAKLLLSIAKDLDPAATSPFIVGGVVLGTFTGAQFKALYAALLAFGPSTFVALGTVLAGISSGSITTPAAIDAAFAALTTSF